jgi:hypothetical protein
MRLRLTSLVLLFSLAGGVLAGMPLHSNEQECNMSSMANMDCCMKAALGQGSDNEVTAARLCCALNCSETGSKPSGVSVPQPLQLSVIPYSAATQPLLPVIAALRGTANSLSPPIGSHPTYIRHHSLLI